MFEKNKAITAAEETAFYPEARGWEADRQARILTSEKRAWLVATVASIAAVAAIGGMAAMAPLKRVVPYVFEVDKATGNAELISAVNDRAATGYQELLDKHWAQAYVLSRETYMYRLLQADYDKTLALSTNEVGRAYAKLYEGDAALDKTLGQSTEVAVTVLSITLSRDSFGSKAVVRLQKSTRHPQTGVTDPPQYYVATLAYEYKPSQTGKEKDLIENPLGYRVTSYRLDPEIAAQESLKPIGLQAGVQP